MTCAEVEEHLLEAVDGPLPDEVRAAVDAHAGGCAACAAFAVRLRQIDVDLAAALPSPPAPPAIAREVRTRIRRERRAAIGESLPDLIHLGGCGLATAISAALLPIEVSVTIAAGLAFTSATYVAMAVVRWSLEAVDQPDW